MKFYLLFICILISQLSSAQKQITSQSQIWFKYYLKIPIDSNWQIRQEIDDRNFINPSRQSQFLERTHLQRNLGNGWDIALGFTYSELASPSDPTIKPYTNHRELRPSFEIAYLNTISKRWTLHHRLWNELRYFQQDDKTYSYANMRVRYKLEAHFEISRWLSLFVFDEIHINLGKNIISNTFDQNRFSMGCQISFIKNIGFEVSYINWFQERSIGDEYYNRDILKLALNHSLPIH